jgi:hypothetical protein
MDLLTNWEGRLTKLSLVGVKSINPVLDMLNIKIFFRYAHLTKLNEEIIEERIVIIVHSIELNFLVQFAGRTYISPERLENVVTSISDIDLNFGCLILGAIWSMNVSMIF